MFAHPAILPLNDEVNLDALEEIWRPAGRAESENIVFTALLASLLSIRKKRKAPKQAALCFSAEFINGSLAEPRKYQCLFLKKKERIFPAASSEWSSTSSSLP